MNSINESAEIVSIELESIEVNKVLPKDNSIEVTIFFNDGDEKEITRDVKLGDPMETAEDILRDISKIQQSINSQFSGKEIVNRNVRVLIKNKEVVKNSLRNFIEKINLDVEKIKECKDPSQLLDLVRKVQKTEIVF